jgi:hypothetical protein
VAGQGHFIRPAAPTSAQQQKSPTGRASRNDRQSGIRVPEATDVCRTKVIARDDVPVRKQTRSLLAALAAKFVGFDPINGTCQSTPRKARLCHDVVFLRRSK